MKKCGIIRICMTVCLILGMLVLPPNQLKAQARESFATVEGTVLSGTTPDLLRLSTKEGTMEIKLDSDTNTSACKVLLLDKRVYVSVAHGNDGYLHAVKITSYDKPAVSTYDSATTSTVTGTIGAKSKEDLIWLNTPQGEMQIKLDAITDMNNCSVLIMGQSYTVVCARGADAYMHAISISDKDNAAPPSVNNYAGSSSVSGTVGRKTKEKLLYLSTKEGEMQFVIDDNADTAKGMILTPDRKLTVYFYHGSDAYLHAVAIVGEKDSSSGVNIDTSQSVTVSGRVGSSSTENILYLNTDQGRMELKLDAVNNMGGGRVLISEQKVTVSCARGSDAYMHAINITAS